jgi:DNA-binding transcriptional LysR family regulator
MDDHDAAKITIEQLQAVALVLQAGSPGAAARRLGRSKAFVTRALNKLESGSGTRLVDRQGVRWRPTEAGHDAAAHLSSLLNEYGRFAALTAQPAPEIAGRLAIASDLEPGLLSLGVWLGLTRQAHPSLELDLQFGVSASEFRDVDLFVSHEPVAIDERALELLGSIGFGFFASPAYLKSNPRLEAPGDLEGHVLIASGRIADDPLWRLTKIGDGAAAPITLPSRPAIVAGSWSDVREAAIAGAGIGLLPLHAAVEAAKTAQLVLALPEWRPPSMSIFCSVLHRAGRDPRVITFLSNARSGLVDLMHEVRRHVAF